jgi:thiamine-phosphate pyrophosphorylase
MHGLYALIDTSAAPERSHQELCAAALDAGTRHLQLRMKGADEGDVERVLLELLPHVRAAGATLILNDHVALAARHDGVGAHVGQDDLPPEEARRLLGPGRLLGLSTHSVEQVRAASALPVDYVGFGPVFSAATKHLSPGDARPAMEARGIAGLKAALEVATVPVVAIGGIDLSNVAAVVEAGARCAAVLSAINAAPDPRAAASAVQRAFAR